MNKTHNALISVTDKNNIDILAKELKKLGINIISTGGTAKFLRKKSIEVIEVENITDFPEILNGRVKTLHPKIFGGILNRRNLKKDQETIKKFKPVITLESWLNHKGQININETKKRYLNLINLGYEFHHVWGPDFLFIPK